MRGKPGLRASRAFAVMALLLTGSCKTTGIVAGAIGAAVGASGDVACDRRFVSGGEASGFCQEVRGTVAASMVRDDCEERHHARALRGRCPVEKRIAGCKLQLLTEDGSEVFDWYYDVRELERASRTAFASHAVSVEEVRRKCADADRYEEGAELVMP